MALATKCPHCHTVFRVALDQLKLRGGIVRCGACNDIFDGNAALVDPAATVAVAPAVAPVPVPAPAAPKLDLDEPATAVEQKPAAPATGSDPLGLTPAFASGSGVLSAEPQVQ